MNDFDTLSVRFLRFYGHPYLCFYEAIENSHICIPSSIFIPKPFHYFV